MSVLDEVLKEEYDRLLRMKTAMTDECASLPNGYLSKKNIRGNVCYYLQHRDGDKIRSVYIKESDVPVYTEKIERRRSLKKSLKQIEAEMDKIERALK